MCVTNSDCPTGHRCHQDSGQCVPISGTLDPIKPAIDPATIPDADQK